MSQKKPVLHSLEELTVLIEEQSFTPDDIVLIPDTSFLSAFSNMHAWADNIFAYIKHISKESDRTLNMIWPLSISNQYERFSSENTLDEFGIPLANRGLVDLQEHTISIRISIPSSSAQSIAQLLWDDSPEGLKRHAETQEEQKNQAATSFKQKYSQPSPGRADLALATYAFGIAAKYKSDVYVASSDFKDVIRPLQLYQKQFKSENLRVTALPPSSLNGRYLTENGTDIEAVVTGEVIGALQQAELTEDSYPLVIFEKGVVSGDVRLDAAVGVASKHYSGELALPAQFDCIRGNMYAFPFVKDNWLGESYPMEQVLLDYLRFFNDSPLRFVHMDEQRPHFPKLYDYTGRQFKEEPLITPHRADLNYLFWDSNSVFAQRNYTPLARR